MYFYILSFFLVISCQLQQAVAVESLAAQPITITSQAAPDTFVNGTISAIEGNFCYTFHHLAVPGHVPLDVIQYYNSHSKYSSWLGTGMSLNYSFWIAGRQADVHPHAFIEGPSGSIIQCRTRDYSNHLKFFLDPEVIKKGLTNVGSGHISARTNLKNIQVTYKINKTETHGQWHVYLPDGSVRKYHKVRDHAANAMNLLHEKRPNRTRLDYSYYKYHEEDGVPRKIEARGKHHLNELAFGINAHHNTGKITTSNGKWAEFTCFEKDGRDYIHKIKTSDNPKVELSYTHAGGYYCIDRISWPDGRFLEMDYDSEGRVKHQKAPVGKNGEKRTIWTLDYQPDDHYTKAVDAYDRKKIYRYKKKRLTALEEYDEQKELYRSHTFLWGRIRDLGIGKQPNNDDGNLISEVLLDKDQIAHSIRNFSYDDWGNVKAETLFGNLSGTGKLSKLSEYGTPRSSVVEAYHRYYWYSKERLHLPLGEWQDSKLAYEYRYEPDTDLMWAKFTKDDTKIILREFYAYDEDGILIEKILDNGTDPNKDIMTDVTQRFITKIVPVKNFHGFGVGQPESMTECYLDLETGKPILLKRTEYSYNKQGLIIKEGVFDANNERRYTLETEYNDKGWVTRRTNALGHVFEYAYDANGNKTYEKQAESGFYTTYEYDKSNRQTAVIQHHDDGTLIRTSSEYDLMGNKIRSTDRYGHTTQYEYDAFNRLHKTIFPTKETITKEYDIFDNVSSETDQNGHTTTFEYTARKQPCKITYADGSQESFVYNLNGTLAHKWDRSGTKTCLSYDVLGRITKIETSDSIVTNHYNAFHLLSTTDPMGYTTHYTYDYAGRKIAEQKESSTTTFAYDSLGRLSCTKQDCIAHYIEYDLLNRVIHEKKLDSSLSYQYDVAGNLVLTRTSHLEGSDAEVKIDFNSQAEPCKVTDVLGHVTTHHVDHGFQNAFRRITTDALGNITEEHFDLLGRKISMLKKNAQNMLLARTDFTYNGTGKKTKQVEQVIIHGIVDHEYTLSWEYDALDRVQKLIEPEGKITSYTYDASGRVQTITKPDDVVIAHAYDALGRLIELKSSDGTILYTYRYDLHNNPLEIKDHVHNIVTLRTYDAWDRVLSDGIKDHYLQTYTYDALGRLTSLTAPDNSSVEYGYVGGYLRKIKRGAFEHNYHRFDLQGRVLESDTIALAWDKKGRNTKITSNYFSQEIPETGYDAVGNLQHLTYSDAIGTVNFQASYDDLYQLTEETGVQSHTYKNDSISNRHKKDEATYLVDHANKLQSDGAHDFAYDKNGNLTQYGALAFTYDALDRLIRVEEGAKTSHYIYDSFHRRIARSTNNAKPQFFLYLGNREIGLWNATEERLEEYRVLGLGKGAELGASVLIELASKQYTPIHDHRGNIVCLINPATGTPQETYRYTAFGECELYDEAGQHITSSKLNNPWGFSSKRHDPETGFIYFHRRYYAPTQGRWITPDPLSFADGPNLYAYLHNNPMTHFDLYGLYSISFADSGLLGLSFQDSNSRENKIAYEQSVQNMETWLSQLTQHGLQRTWENTSGHEIFARFVHGVEQSLYSMGMPLGPEMVGAKQGVSSGLAKIGVAEAKAVVSPGALSNEARLTVNSERPATILSESRYVPKCRETGKPLSLPRSKDGVNLPSADTPHTQLGWRNSKKGNPYPQTREWGYNEKEIKTTDWTDHGTPLEHSNPHDHPFLKNATGGTPERGIARKFKVTDEKMIRDTR